VDRFQSLLCWLLREISTMTAQFQYTRLAYQANAVQSIADVFTDVRFVEPASVHANPVYVPGEAHTALRANIERIRQGNQVTAGVVEAASTLTPPLSLDVLMETGTGKTFTFIETMHRLHQEPQAVEVHRAGAKQRDSPGHASRACKRPASVLFSRNTITRRSTSYNYSDKSVQEFHPRGQCRKPDGDGGDLPVVRGRQQADQQARGGGQPVRSARKQLHGGAGRDSASADH
jgi:hypothetical protein